MTIQVQQTRALGRGRTVYLRPDTSDRQVWADTFTGLYHVPPEDMPVPATVLDLGANIGLTAAHYRVMWPDAKIIAVEMDEDCADLAEKNAPGVMVRRHAVSGEGGWGSYNPALLAEAFSFRPHNAQGKMVRSFTLQQIILRGFGDDGVDFCKMDVESEEWSIFEHGAWAPHVRCLLVELHPAGDMPDDSDWLLAKAISELEAIGFKARHHPPHPRAVWAWHE